MALIEINGLPNLKMGGFSMANCECHNQRVHGLHGFVGPSASPQGIPGHFLTLFEACVAWHLVQPGPGPLWRHVATDL